MRNAQKERGFVKVDFIICYICIYMLCVRLNIRLKTNQITVWRVANGFFVRWRAARSLNDVALALVLCLGSASAF